VGKARVPTSSESGFITSSVWKCVSNSTIYHAHHCTHWRLSLQRRFFSQHLSFSHPVYQIAKCQAYQQNHHRLTPGSTLSRLVTIQAQVIFSSPAMASHQMFAVAWKMSTDLCQKDGFVNTIKSPIINSSSTHARIHQEVFGTIHTMTTNSSPPCPRLSANACKR